MIKCMTGVEIYDTWLSVGAVLDKILTPPVAHTPFLPSTIALRWLLGTQSRDCCCGLGSKKSPDDSSSAVAEAVPSEGSRNPLKK